MQSSNLLQLSPPFSFAKQASPFFFNFLSALAAVKLTQLANAACQSAARKFLHLAQRPPTIILHGGSSQAFLKNQQLPYLLNHGDGHSLDVPCSRHSKKKFSPPPSTYVQSQID